jgi:hypothetical protein
LRAPVKFSAKCSYAKLRAALEIITTPPVMTAAS